MNQQFIPFNPFSEPEWPYWWHRRRDGGMSTPAVGYSRARIIEQSDDIKTYSYVVTPVVSREK